MEQISSPAAIALKKKNAQSCPKYQKLCFVIKFKVGSQVSQKERKETGDADMKCALLNNKSRKNKNVINIVAIFYGNYMNKINLIISNIIN